MNDNDNKPKFIPGEVLYIEWGHVENMTQEQFPTWYEDPLGSKMWQKILVVEDKEWTLLPIETSGDEVFLGCRMLNGVMHNIWLHEGEGVYVAQPKGEDNG